MKRFLEILGIVVGVLIIVGLSIWLGFPATQSFNRFPICFAGYMIGAALIFIGSIAILNDISI